MLQLILILIAKVVGSNPNMPVRKVLSIRVCLLRDAIDGSELASSPNATAYYSTNGTLMTFYLSGHVYTE